MSSFLFDGRSRPNHMKLVSDTGPSREQILADAAKRRQRRDDEARRQRAAERIQRAVRGLLARQQAVRLAVAALAAGKDSILGSGSNSSSSNSNSSTGKEVAARLGRLCWRYQFVKSNEAVIPVSELAISPKRPDADTANTENSSRSGGGGGWGAVAQARTAAVLRRSHQVVAVVRHILTNRTTTTTTTTTGGDGGEDDFLSNMPDSAVSFVSRLLLADVAGSLATGNTAAADAAQQTLSGLAAAAAGKPAVVEQLVCSCLERCGDIAGSGGGGVSVIPSPLVDQTVRDRLLAFVTPLIPLCASQVAITTSANSSSTSGGSGDWSRTCWGALSSSHDDAYMPLTSDPIAALLCTVEQGSSSSGGNQSAADVTTTTTQTVLMILQVAYDHIVTDSFMDAPAPAPVTTATTTTTAASPTTAAPTVAAAAATAASFPGRWWEPQAMAVLGRLTRLLPFFLAIGEEEQQGQGQQQQQQRTPRRLARAAWLACIGALCERLCQTQTFTRTVLFDLHHSRVQKQQQQQQGSDGGGGALAAAPAAPGRTGAYRSLVSHLFSSEGGLKLMAQLASAAEASGSDNTDDNNGNVEEEAGEGSAAETTPSAPPLLHFFSREDEARLLACNELEAVCGVYAWPLFTFSIASVQHRLETSAMFAKLARTPRLLRQLWHLYRARCDGLAALLPAGELLERLCTRGLTPNVAVRLPFWLQPPPALLAAKGLSGRHGMFWDPQPALAALFFTLLGYYVDVTDVAEDIKVGAVMTAEETWALVLALKEITHRTHFHGVVPGESCEAVAHLAYLLLSKLHIVNEATRFVPYPSLWVSTTEQLVMTALGSVTPEQWDRLFLKREREQRRLQQRMDDEMGDGYDEDDDWNNGNEERNAERARVVDRARRRGQPVPPAAASSSPPRPQRHPGDDIVFSESTSWALEERVVRLLFHTPFLLPFPDRAALLTMLLLRTQPERQPGRPQFFVVHRGRTFVDAFDKFHARPDSTEMFSVRFAAAATAGGRGGPRRRIGRRQGGGGGGGLGMITRLLTGGGGDDDDDDDDSDDDGNEEDGAVVRLADRHRMGRVPPPGLHDRGSRGGGRLSHPDHDHRHGREDEDDEEERGGGGGGSGTDPESETGLEAGYGHGVYREFMRLVCKEGFDAQHGLFTQTEDGYVYPNPFSFEATGDPHHLQKMGFLGTMVGRAFRDGILQDCAFALHFRNSLLNRRNSINNLRSFDEQLYVQLMSLAKMTDAEMEAMCMTFTWSVNALGITKEVELIKGGANIAVTKNNCLQYIQLVADFRLNREGHGQVAAFRAGLERIMLPSWLQLFDSNELLNLLGGDQTGKIDLADWKKHTTYNPTDAKNSPSVRIFWEVVESLSSDQQSKLLQFATSMNRPPLLGFRFLDPPFHIHVISVGGENRLPTSSTCFSTLKLPPYVDYAVAREKIIAAIEETNTFGLT